ncbi:MAG: threonine synthase [Candidatus Heimdallarchaeota archaeon]
MSFLQALQCGKCGKTYEATHLQTVCNDCAKPLLARYDLEGVKDAITPRVFKERPADMWRYWELLPVKEQKHKISLGEGVTPLLQLRKTAKALGMKELWLKDDGKNPTNTFKCRGLSVAVSKAKEFGVRKLVIPTAGNAGGALAAYAQRAGLEAYVIMPADAPQITKIETTISGAHVFLVEGLISDAGKIARELETAGFFNVSTLREPYRVEGKKTMGLEIAEDLNWELPDVIIYPTGGGTGIIGIWKAFKELETLGWISEIPTRMFSVQTEGCAPIIKAWREGKDESEFWEGAKTVAAGLRIPKPLGDFLILRALKESNGGAVAVKDEELLEGVQKLAMEGLFVCPEGGATLSGLKHLRAQGEIDKDERVVLLNTGTGIKYVELFNADLPVIRNVQDILD